MILVMLSLKASGLVGFYLRHKCPVYDLELSTANLSEISRVRSIILISMISWKPTSTNGFTKRLVRITPIISVFSRSQFGIVRS